MTWTHHKPCASGCRAEARAFRWIALPLAAGVLLGSPVGLGAQAPTAAGTAERLAEAVRAIERETGGTLGVAARHVTRPLAFDHRAEEVFPAASVIKLHLLVRLHRLAERGELSFDETLILGDDDRVGGTGRLQNEPAGSAYTLTELARLMIVISDNVATNMLIRRAGGMERINEELRSLGVERSRFQRFMMDAQARARGIENEISAGETAELLVGLDRCTVGRPESCRAILDVLLAQELRDRMPALLPEGTRVGHKTGTLAGIAHDAGIIYAPSGPIALAVLTRGIADAAVAQSAIQRIARLVYDAWGALPERR